MSHHCGKVATYVVRSLDGLEWFVCDQHGDEDLPSMWITRTPIVDWFVSRGLPVTGIVGKRFCVEGVSDEPDPVGLPAGPLKCATVGCDRLAVMIVFWPGQTTRMCGFCVVRAHGIAKAMGFELSATLDDGRQLGGLDPLKPGAYTAVVDRDALPPDARPCLGTCAPDTNYHDPQCSKRDPPPDVHCRHCTDPSPRCAAFDGCCSAAPPHGPLCHCPVCRLPPPAWPAASSLVWSTGRNPRPSPAPRDGSTCVRCGAPYGPDGNCSARLTGPCQGGRGEMGGGYNSPELHPLDKAAGPPASADVFCPQHVDGSHNLVRHGDLLVCPCGAAFMASPPPPESTEPGRSDPESDDPIATEFVDGKLVIIE